jgi:hypothetical protein
MCPRNLHLGFRICLIAFQLPSRKSDRQWGFPVVQKLTVKPYRWEKPKPVDPALHNVWILDNTAFRDGENWKAEFVACYFIKNTGKDVSKAVATVADALDLDLGDKELQKRMAKRLQPFADQILPNRTLEVTVDGKETLKLGPSNQSGYSSDVRDLDFQ